MNPLVYNVCLLLGVLLVGVGEYLTSGIGRALSVTGLLLVVLTGFTALVARRG